MKEMIKKEIEFIKEHIKEYEQKRDQSESLALTFFYDGLIVAFQTTQAQLEFILAASETEIK